MHQRRRIVLLFGFGIVLPSLLLGYLAFRGIQNDRALVEKERLEAIQKASDRVVRSVDAAITAVEDGLSEAAAKDAGPPPAGMPAALEKLAAGDPLIEQVFQFLPTKVLRFPLEKPLYIPDGSREAGPSAAGESRQQAEYLAAQRLEFRDNDLTGALAAYRRLLGRTRDARLSAMILNAVARVQKKSGLAREAASTYETILRDHAAVVMPGGMPLGPSASLEICGLTRELGDPTRSLRTGLALYRSLVRREWTVEKAEFELFAGRGKEHIQTLITNPPPGIDLQAFRTEYEALSVEEAASRKRTERMAVFQEGAAPALEAKIRAVDAPGTAGPRFVRSTLDIGGISYLVTVERPSPAGRDTAEGAWGAILDAGRLQTDVFRPALLDLFPSGVAAWTVRGRDGAVLLSSGDPSAGPAALRTNFASDFPSWALEFHQAPPRLIKTFLLSRRGLYFFIFLLIAGILVFGLVLTLRSVSHELELARLKSDFVSTVSHEFKSPLTSIRQLAEMLQSGRVPSEERRQKYYDVLLEQSERLALLTDNILSLAKIESGRAALAFETTDIPALLAGVVTSIQERVRHEGFDIGLDIEGTLPLLSVDRTAFSQAITNLIDNAIKYSGESRKVSVRAAVEGKAAAIAVRDCGIGIRKEDLQRLFERFYRAGDELTRAVKGSGLGLTLVKEIVEAHRGTIEVESEPGRGSVFTIRLPLP
jgi:signal transduction histidine kinase